MIINAKKIFYCKGKKRSLCIEDCQRRYIEVNQYDSAINFGTKSYLIFLKKNISKRPCFRCIRGKEIRKDISRPESQLINFAPFEMDEKWIEALQNILDEKGNTE